MSYAASDGRQQLLDTVAGAIDEIGVALAMLGDAYELLDETTADRLEEQLFRPVQSAYGRAKRTHSEFAARHGLQTRVFEPAGRGAPSHGAKGFLDGAVDAVLDADEHLSILQDSMLPIEVGDPEVRAGLAEVRTLLAELEPRARRFVSTLGR